MRRTLTGLLFFFAFCLARNASSQIVYVTEWKSEANKKVFITDSPGDADLIVFKTDWKSDAKKDSGLWYFTEWKTEADMLIYFTDWKSEADIVICYTDWKSDAGWKK